MLFNPHTYTLLGMPSKFNFFFLFWEQGYSSETDTSAMEARNGKDIQGIPWEMLNYSRDRYRETRLKQYQNYENLSQSREELHKECLQVEKGNNFYDFQLNTRLVKSTIVHFQVNTVIIITMLLSFDYLYFLRR